MMKAPLRRLLLFELRLIYEEDGELVEDVKHLEVKRELE